jgi:serine protease Do
MSKALSSRPGHARSIGLRMILPALAMAILPWAAEALAGAAPAAPAATATAPRLPQSPQLPVTVPANVLAGSQGFADLAERLLPTVVNISTSQTLKRRPDQQKEGQGQQPPQGTPFDDFFKNFSERDDRPRRVQSLGSGFIIDAAGYVVTNNHVIEGADEITVILEDGDEMKATLVGTDEKTDLALLKVNPSSPLPVARMGDSEKARVGEWVMAIGDPFGLGGTVTTGIISARNRDINAGAYDDFIQTDAPINRGNSGGPLFNMYGEVIGVNSAIYSPTGGSVGIGFAIPINAARNVIGQLRAGGIVQRGWLGVRIQEVTGELAESLGLDKGRGALIAGMDEKGPAQKAGIQNGDVVLTFDGKPVADNRALPRMVADAPIGKTVNVEIMRRGQKRTLPITVQRLEDDQKVASADPETSKQKSAPRAPVMTNLGMTLAPITGESRRRYRLDEKVQGVVVTDVDGDSPAGLKNIRTGDVITEVAQQKITSPEDFSAKLEAERRANHRIVLLQVSRGGELTFIGVRLDP